MNSNDVNSVINNLCDKLGTTASKLIPEMAGYQIAKHSIWLVVSLIFIGVAIGLTIRLLWMKRNAGHMLVLYPDMIKKLDQRIRDDGILDDLHPYSRTEWSNLLERVGRVQGTLEWDESTWIVMVLTAIWSGLMGIVIFGVALYHIIGWSIAPNASAFMWIMQQLGGGQ